MFSRPAAIFFLSLLLASGAWATEALPRVTMETSAGDIVIELDAVRAPETVRNFLAYVDKGFYEDVIFHRVIPGFMAQGGGYDTAYQLKQQDPPIPNESRNGLSNLRGTIAMARTANPDSANSQFFINLADNARLDGSEDRWGYAVFGRVVAGMDVVDRITEIPTGPAGPFRQNVPQGMVIIERVTRVSPGQANAVRKSDKT